MLLPRRNLISHGKLAFLRQNVISCGKLTIFLRHILVSRAVGKTGAHSKTYSLTTKLTLSPQNFLSRSKTFSLTAKLTLSRQNLLSHSKTFSLTAKLTLSRQNAQKLKRSALSRPLKSLVCREQIYFHFVTLSFL